jgi:hypothetical protein
MPSFFHHAARRLVGQCGDGDDFVEAEFVESVVYDCLCAFGGESFALSELCEAPADLDCGLREIGDGVAHDLQADGSDEVAGVAQGGGEEAEAVAVEGGEVAVDGFVAFSTGHQGGEVVHDDGVGVHSGEGLAVGLQPAAEEEEERGFELERLGQAWFSKKEESEM